MPPITNTLETTRRLEGMGFAQQQARGLAEQQDLKSFIASQIESLRNEIRSGMKALEERLRAEFHRELRVQLLMFTTIQGALVATFLGLMKLFG